jgi:DNA repair exonuclease SbcCD ATPase subunit
MKDVPVEIQATTTQINSMLHTVEKRNGLIDQLNNRKKQFQEAFNEYTTVEKKVKELQEQNKQDRKTIDALIDYTKNNYGFDFTPGDLFNQNDVKSEPITETQGTN